MATNRSQRVKIAMLRSVSPLVAVSLVDILSNVAFGQSMASLTMQDIRIKGSVHLFDLSHFWHSTSQHEAIHDFVFRIA